MEDKTGGFSIGQDRRSIASDILIYWQRCILKVLFLAQTVTIGSPIVRIYSQVADLGSACKLAPQSPGLPQTERLSMRVLKSILKLREVGSLSMRTIYSFPKRSSDQTYVNKHQQT